MEMKTLTKHDDGFSTTTLRNIVSVYTDKVKDLSFVFRDVVLTDLSFSNNINNVKFYFNKQAGSNKICYLQVADKDGIAITLICDEVVFTKSVKKYALDKSKSIDVRVDFIDIDYQGKLFIKIKSIRENGISELELKKKMINEYCTKNNYFVREKKRLPEFLSSIALITTNSGNTASDIIKQVGLKSKYIQLYTCNSNSKEIANTLREVSTNGLHQLVVLFRGGNEDKSMINFSEICVLDAVVDSPIMVASAIGHESDRPIVQFVADYGYDTPSSFARAIAQNNIRFTDKVLKAKMQTRKSVAYTLAQKKNQIIDDKNRTKKSIFSVLLQKKSKVFKLNQNIALNIKNTVEARRLISKNKKQKTFIYLLAVAFVIAMGFVFYK